MAKAEAAEASRGSTGRRGLHLVVMGHVDAGKSTLMGRLLHDLGQVSQKEVHKNQRESAQAGKVRTGTLLAVVVVLCTCGTDYTPATAHCLGGTNSAASQHCSLFRNQYLFAGKQSLMTCAYVHMCVSLCAGFVLLGLGA